MAALIEGAVGILPAGALGVSFFYHLTQQLRRVDRVFFIERAGSSSATALRDCGELLIDDGAARQRVSVCDLLKPDLLQNFARGGNPELLIICPNPDQLQTVLATGVQLLERAHECETLTPTNLPLPILVLSSNGIYFQRIRQLFVEKLEESTLLGRLPDLWPDLMPRIVGRLLRGVTIQTGLRDGSGASTVYHPGPRGITRLAGGDEEVRARAGAIFTELGGWFELARHSSATRLEFDKGMVNLVTNLLGQLYAIDERGVFTLMRVEQILTPEHEAEMRELTRHVFRTGQAVKAYAPNDRFEELFTHVLETCRLHSDHVPSSLQWVGLRLRQGKLEPKLTPTEDWLLTPLIRYAHAAGLQDDATYFERLRDELLRKLSLAARA